VINPQLHKKPVALDREKHRSVKLKPGHPTLKAAAEMNAFFVSAAEFVDVCREYPILFLAAGNDDKGRMQVAPVAVFGMTQGENLFLKADGTWDAFYVPAMLRAYPFTMARIAEDQFAVCMDEAWDGFTTTGEGRELFDDKGEPTPLLQDLRKFVEQIEVETERTRLAGQRLVELNLLQPKRFDATMPDGKALVVDGFLAVDEERLAKLSDAEVLELQRSGLMGLLHAHQISLGNMRRLLERRILIQAAATTAA
jgi:hypothetical protein